MSKKSNRISPLPEVRFFVKFLALSDAQADDTVFQPTHRARFADFKCT